MKASLLHKGLSTVLSVLVLLSTLSVTIEKHFCGGQLVDVAVFSKLDRCGGDIDDMPTSDTLKSSCCKDEVDVIEGIDDLNVTVFEDVEIKLQKFAVVFFISYYLHSDGVSNPIPSGYYKPPNLVKDIYILNETYLI
ncbi:hypothetical protein [uncultured Winogradskyella sp.]|uniref:HYC_CC_PP family protein n=1 Tax=uncultured Winogradskyella sp. TaxID=395353 RepID=UPI003513855C